LPPELLLLAQICTKSFVGWGFAPDPTGGAYSAPPDPLAGLRGLLLRGGEGRGEEGIPVKFWLGIHPWVNDTHTRRLCVSFLNSSQRSSTYAMQIDYEIRMYAFVPFGLSFQLMHRSLSQLCSFCGKCIVGQKEGQTHKTLFCPARHTRVDGQLESN